MQFVSAGSEFVLDLHRFCDASAQAKFEIGSAKDFHASVETDAFQMRVTIPPAARGLVDLPFAVTDGANRKSGVLTLAVRPPTNHEFVYRPETPAKTVAVAGVFNGWSNVHGGPEHGLKEDRPEKFLSEDGGTARTQLTASRGCDKCSRSKTRG